MNYSPYEPKRLYRSRDNSRIFGVCGGLAEYFDLSPFGVRLIFVLLFIFSGGFPVLLSYIIMGFLIKPEPLRQSLPGGLPYSTMSHADLLGHIQQRFEALDKRLQRMETVVTRPGFGLEQKYRDLK